MRRALLGLALAAALLAPSPAAAACEAVGITPDTPTGIAGCVVYGVGTASWYTGSGVARNDCVWPWTACKPITITALDTGRTVTVTPTMYCDCWLGHDGPNGETPRIADLDRATVAALGLSESQGLFQVRVEPADATGTTPRALPDTAMGPLLGLRGGRGRLLAMDWRDDVGWVWTWRSVGPQTFNPVHQAPRRLTAMVDTQGPGQLLLAAGLLALIGWRIVRRRHPRPAPPPEPVTRHSPRCTWYLGYSTCDCEELVGWIGEPPPWLSEYP